MFIAGEIVQSVKGYATIRICLLLTCAHVKASMDMGFCYFKDEKGRDRLSPGS